MRASVMRLLLTGGLMTQDVVTRHRNQQTTNCNCSMGGPQSIQHISWHCPHYQQKRDAIRALMPRILRSKPCFQYATILTDADSDLFDNIILIQSTLVDIWQDFIRAYLTGDLPGADDTDGPHPTNTSSSARDVSDGIHENGHFITSAPDGGIFCRKCGKFVREIRHRRLKISKKKCTQADLPETHWLSTPCFTSNPRRLLGLFLDMQQYAARHDLIWNGSVSRQRENPGRIKCRLCGKSWPWDNRHNMQRALCADNTPSEVPDGWVSMHFAANNPDATVNFLSGTTDRQDSTGDVSAPMMMSTASASSQTIFPGAASSSSTTACPPVRIRLRRKTTISFAANPFSSSTAPTDFSASSSHPVTQSVTNDLDESLFTVETVSFAHFDDMG